MQLYNTETHRKEEFTPLNPKQATMYCCGPTVYNYAHIGNMRTYIFEDLLDRTLRLHWPVKHVMNVTDVGHLVSDADDGEDKMEVGAAREGKSAWDIAKFYEEKFFADSLHAPDGYQPRYCPYTGNDCAGENLGRKGIYIPHVRRDLL